MDGAVDELAALLAAGADVAAVDGGCEKSSTMEAFQHAKETTAVNLGALLDPCDDAVVTLVAGETRLVAHRAVLVHRSPVFAAMFRHDTLESRSGQVDIVDVEGPVLRQLVSYLYTLRAPQLIEIDAVTQLLAAADKYGVAGLKAAWEQQVAAQLSVETAAAAAVLAVRYSCKNLRKASISFLKDHTREVMASRGWEDVMRSHPDDLMEVNRLLAAKIRRLTAEKKRRRFRESAMDGLVELLAAIADASAVDGGCEIGSRKTTAVKNTKSSNPQSPGPRSRRHTMPHFKHSSTMQAIENAKETTAVDLGALLDAGDDAMVTLVAGETRLVAHRAVLMERSPVFNAMFRHDTLESRSGQVTIVDVEGPVLRQLVSYVYTLRAPQLPDLDMVTQLLVAADKYGVDSLKAACEQQVAAQLSVETAAATAVLALRYSCKNLRKASISFLKDHTREVMASRGWEDVMRSHPDDLMEVNRLLAAKIRSLPAEERSRRLIQAAKKGAVGELEALLAAGADVAARDGNRMTALHWAARWGHVEAARLLLARGAEVDARGCAQGTPLHLAAACGDVAVVRLLLAASADHSARTSAGWTPLHYAAANGNTEAAAVLLEAGADRAATEDKGRTALDLARERNQQQLVELLTRT